MEREGWKEGWREGGREGERAKSKGLGEVVTWVRDRDMDRRLEALVLASSVISQSPSFGYGSVAAAHLSHTTLFQIFHSCCFEINVRIHYMSEPPPRLRRESMPFPISAS